MRLHDDDVDSLAADEPEDGWVSSEPLIDTEITSLTLCRYTGKRVGFDEFCFDRIHGRHRDVSCVTLFFQAAALSEDGELDQAKFPQAQEVVRTHTAGDDPIGTTHEPLAQL